MVIFLERFLLSAAVAALVVTVVRMRKDIRRQTGRRRAREAAAAEAAAEGDAGGGFDVPGGVRNVGYAAGLPLSLPLLVFILIEIGALVAVLLWSLFESRWPGVFALVVVPVALWSILVEIGRRRALRFEEKLIQAVELMIGALRSGDTPRRALEGLADNAEPPVRGEFTKLLRKLDLGVGVHRALAPIVRSYDSDGLRLFAATLAAKMATGGDLIPVLESLDWVLRERLRHRIRVSSQLAGAKVAALMVGIAPYVLLLAFYFFKKDWIDRVFEHPYGLPLFLGAICLQLLGFAGLIRVTRMEM